MYVYSPFILCVVALLISPAVTQGAECSAKSAHHVVPLLELYTSEGCSSCPPADKWLSNLTLSSDQITPLAFHVDYWDYIGWKDRFAKFEFSDRQRKSAANGGVGFVYTPQFTLNGKDFRRWNEAKLNQAIASSKNQISDVQLSMNLTTQKNGENLLTANVQANTNIKQADIFVAVYENNLESEVISGENNGRKLKHDYVVLDLFGGYSLNDNQAFSKSIPLKQKWKSHNAGAVLFVQDKNGIVLQSLSLPFCKS